jgi:hypothetical protein
MGHLCKLLFIGDGVMHKLQLNDTLWTDLQQKYASIMLAFPGDKTENILQRLYSVWYLKEIIANPMIVVYAGMTNLAVGDKRNSIVAAVNIIVNTTLSKFPNSPVVLLSLLPRSHRFTNNTVTEINMDLRKFYESSERVTFLNINPAFRNPNVETDLPSANPFLIQDLYPNELGFEVLMKQLQPVFDKVRYRNYLQFSSIMF